MRLPTLKELLEEDVNEIYYLDAGTVPSTNRHVCPGIELGEWPLTDAQIILKVESDVGSERLQRGYIRGKLADHLVLGHHRITAQLCSTARVQLVYTHTAYLKLHSFTEQLARCTYLR